MMKTTLVPIALVLLVGAASARAQSQPDRLAEHKSEYCKSTESLTRAVVKARDAGEPKADVIAAVRRQVAAEAWGVSRAQADAILRASLAQVDFVYGNRLGADAAAKESFRACQSGVLGMPSPEANSKKWLQRIVP
jgi:hypothetical protein